MTIINNEITARVSQISSLYQLLENKEQKEDKNRSPDYPIFHVELRKTAICDYMLAYIYGSVPVCAQAIP